MVRASCSPPSDPHAIVGRGHWWSRPTVSDTLKMNLAIPHRWVWEDSAVLFEFLFPDENQLVAGCVALVVSGGFL